MPRKILLLLWCAVWCALMPAGVIPESAGFGEPLDYRHRTVAPGVDYYYYRYASLYGAPQSIHILVADMARDGLCATVKMCGPKRMTPAQFGQKYHALAVINAGFFQFSSPPRPAYGFRLDGRLLEPFPDRPDLGVILFPGKGEPVKIIAGTKLPEQVPNARQSTPLLLLNGKMVKNYRDGHNKNREPRTAVGITSADRMIWVVVDGRSKEAGGITCADLAAFLALLDCREALNLDGGGSSAMWIHTADGGETVSFPSDNKKFDHAGARPVNDAIILCR